MRRNTLYSIVAAAMITLAVSVLPVRAAELDKDTEELSATASEEPVSDEGELNKEDEDQPLSGAGDVETEEQAWESGAEAPSEESDAEPQAEEADAERQPENGEVLPG